MMSSAPERFSLDHLPQQQQQQQPPPLGEQEQLCYVHCNFCDTILAVGVPCSSLFKTVTVRCGHCANLLFVNLRGLLLPAAATAANHQQLPFGQALLSPTSPRDLLDEVPSFQAPPSALTEQSSPNVSSITSSNSSCANSAQATSMASAPKAAPRQPQPPKSSSSANRTSEKRQRVPSAYNRFIKDEIQRIKASNPDITHREAFSAAAKNWAHFPHIHFGLMPDQGLKKTGIQSQQDGAGEECMFFKDGLYAAAAAAAASSMGVTPF
ncbi:hypothetical protein GUJ93_ZPchr0014g46805 [Zizania palustris]|uniref:Uncharacterized protein n=1 Tax=Zizania palustris TaxID=103762 RepID=A0A8J5W0P9_ZIZPA|nr:hypothetical protein GUJ93_ZPchr0014g46805 [Zizania palustris]